MTMRIAVLSLFAIATSMGANAILAQKKGETGVSMGQWDGDANEDQDGICAFAKLDADSKRPAESQIKFVTDCTCLPKGEKKVSCTVGIRWEMFMDARD